MLVSLVVACGGFVSGPPGTGSSTGAASFTVVVSGALTVDLAFTTPMGTSALIAANYSLSGTGIGTLSAHPDSVSAVMLNQYRLTWNSGEMLNGGDITVAVDHLSDLLHNALTGQATHAGGGIGMAPTLIGLADDATPLSTKSWAWSCSEACTYRFFVDRTAGTAPTGLYGAIAVATQMTGNGTYYLHVQARDAAGNESTIRHVSAVLSNPTSTIMVRVRSGNETMANSDTQQVMRNDGTTISITDVRLKFVDSAASAKLQIWQSGAQVGVDSGTESVAGGGWVNFHFSPAVVVTGNYNLKIVSVSGTPTFYMMSSGNRLWGYQIVGSPDGYCLDFELYTLQGPDPDYLVKEDFELGTRPADWEVSDYYGYVDWGYATAPAPLAGAHSLAVTGTGRLAMKEFAPQNDVWVSWIFSTSDITFENTLRLLDADHNILVNLGISPNGSVSSAGLSSAPAGTVAAGVPTHYWVHYTKGTGANANVDVYLSATSTRPADPTMSNGFTGSQTAPAGAIGLFNDNYNIAILDSVRVSSSPIGGAVAPHLATGLGWSTNTGYSTTATATWTKSISSTVISQGLQLYTGAACDSPYGGLIALAAGDQSKTFTGLPDDTYTYKITSTDGAGLSVTTACSPPATTTTPTWTKSGSVYTTDGTQFCVNSAIGDASPGDTVLIPAGTFTWGAGGVGTVLNKNVTLRGAGQSSTTVNQASDSGYALIYLGGGSATTNAVLRGFTLNQHAGSRLIRMSGMDGWRVTDMTINGTSGRVFDIDGAYGLVDHSNINIFSESIFMYGKTDAWTTVSTPGTDQAVYFEDCVFDGSGDGYTDGNSNAKFVYRFNTVRQMMKFDAHGVWSNTPPRSARNTESYYNTWTAIGSGSFTPTHEIRGGTGFVFFNTALDNTFEGRGILKLYGYGAVLLGGYFSRYQGPDDYPIFDQVGVGKDQLPEPLYLWGNRKTAAYPGGGAMEIVSDWGPIPSQAINEYRARIGNSAATYTMDDIVKRDRDYFIDPSTGGGAGGGTPVAFDGTSGVGIGTRAQMNAITPTKIGVGFWVTNEGSWNTTLPANTSGRLYKWNGSAWQLSYTPYTYPHPLIGSP